MKPDDKNADLVGVAVFESKEAYVANANDPEQHEAFTKMMEHLEAEPSWTDGEYIRSDMTYLCKDSLEAEEWDVPPDLPRGPS